ncbi:MAG TPA: tRNA (N(6)-L-threonylcarbamoyladenosine(37)-C(2))-methylthiotransferase MtaB [Actinomycetota bacterium]|nr:tRNA (N(6)-L-threonylcarbamoyladenosine(37)-C(2))-methylthiotransferase MtaB [Actinomycetota bacterium]
MGGYRFVTLGCRLNQAESDLMAEELEGAGLQRAADEESPQLIVVNTCTVTKEATKASRMALRRSVKNNPGARVVAIGCYAESDPDEIASIDGVDAILGNSAKERFLDALADNGRAAPLLQIGGIVPRAPTITPAVKVRANLKVQTGCDEWCTFCIIPTTRGPLRSMDEDSLVADAQRRVAQGTREIVLTGVHLGKYRFDSGGDERDLIRLFERLLAIDGLLRLRVSSILSDHLTDDVIEFIAGQPKMCRYLHVPLQAGHDDVLAAMHRPYRVAAYIDRVEAAKERIPGLALATDIIVGFPGETEEQFEATLEVVERIRFSKLHVFRFSPRARTPAAEMPDAVDGNVKKERSKRLIALGNRLRNDFLADHLGRPLEVLVEDEREIEGTRVCSGQTSDYVRVWFEGTGLLGRTVRVLGHEVRADGIRGGTIVDVAV